MNRYSRELLSLKTIQISAASFILVGCGGGSSKSDNPPAVVSSAALVASSAPITSSSKNSVGVSSVLASSLASSLVASSSSIKSSVPSSSVASSLSSSVKSSSASVAATINISGKAVAKDPDVKAVATLSENITRYIAKLNPIGLAWAAADTGASTNSALPNATVDLVKVFGNGKAEEKVNIGAVTTDGSGAYAIPNIDKVPASDGTNASFYYEVRVTKGTLTLKTPVAATADVNANVSPETDLAAKMLTSVVAVPGVDKAPLPANNMVEAARELVLGEAAKLTDDKAIAIPSATSVNYGTNAIAAANGLASNGGNAEKLFKAASFSAEKMALTNNTASTTADATGYVNRVVREGCNQAQGDYLPQPIAEAFGEYFNAKNTLTPTEIVDAYNQKLSGSQITLNTAVQNFQTMLTEVTSKLSATATTAGAIDKNKQLALYTMRSLNPTSFGATTPLDADQALAFIQTLGPQQCQFAPQLDMFGFISLLLKKPALAQPYIAFADIYHNSGFGCDEGAGKGHFMATVKVNKNGKTISSVSIASNDTDGTVLGGDAKETLTMRPAPGSFETYESNTDSVCVNLGKAVSYTVTVTFSDTSSPITTTVARNHPRIPEASSKVQVGDAFQAGSDDSSKPTVVTVSRPLYQWTSPDDLFKLIVNDAKNVAIKSSLLATDYFVKYTYEFSHIDTSVTPVGPAQKCASVPAGALYSVDSFTPTESCDVTTCAMALGVAASKIACRMNIQSYLVDKNDKILGQAAGHFRFFCVDKDGDGKCG